MVSTTKRTAGIPKVIAANVADLLPDNHNLNKGTERGDYLLGQSLSTGGAGRSILLDKKGRIIAGNKTAQKYGELGSEDVLIVQTDGTKLVAVQRTDIDLDSPEGRALALADNRTTEVNLSWNATEMDFLTEKGLLEPNDWFHPNELSDILDAPKDSGDRYDPYVAESGEKPSSTKEIDPDGFKLEHRCPKCGFEFDDK